MQAEPRRGLVAWCSCGPVRPQSEQCRVQREQRYRLPPRKRARSRRLTDLRTERHLGLSLPPWPQTGENRTGPERPVALWRRWFRPRDSGVSAAPRRYVERWCSCGPVRPQPLSARVLEQWQYRLPPRKRVSSRRLTGLRTERHLGWNSFLGSSPGKTEQGRGGK